MISKTKEYLSMLIVEIVGLVFFIVLMTIGYRKNSRNMMLVASLCLLVALSGPDFTAGVIAGFNEPVTS